MLQFVFKSDYVIVSTFSFVSCLSWLVLLDDFVRQSLT